MNVCSWCLIDADEAAARHEGPHATWCPHHRSIMQPIPLGLPGRATKEVEMADQKRETEEERKQREKREDEQKSGDQGSNDDAAGKSGGSKK